jgi:hypothetical protein
MGRAARYLVLAASLAPAACAALAGLQDVPAVQDGGPPGDATTENVATEGGVDASAEAAPSDAPGIDDALGDSGNGSTSCADAGAVFCDDFEEGLDNTNWPTAVMQNGSVAVDTSKPYRGARSLHAVAFPVADDAAPGDVIGTLVHPVVLPQTVYIRTFVFFSAINPADSESFVLARQNHPNFLGIEVEVQGPNWGITDWTPNPSVNDHNGPAADAMRWHCVEWMVTQGGSGATDVWLDGQELTALHLTNLMVADLEQIEVGLNFYYPPPQGQYELWVDDVYVDTSPVGCTK